MSEKVSKEKAAQIADLIKISIVGEEEKFAEILSDTLDYISILDELDTTDTKETYQVTGQVNVFQNGDENTQTLNVKEALKNAPRNERNLFVTGAVFDRS